MNVAWKSVVGYEHMYEVSNHGQVRSLDRFVKRQGENLFRAGHILRVHPNRNGYLLVRLSKDGVSTGYSVHQIVARAFHGLPDDGQQVNHLNGDKADNRPENLAWCSFVENVRHSYKELGRMNLPGEFRKNARGVAKFDRDGNFIESYPTLAKAASVHNILVTSIANCIKGRSKTAGGYQWQALRP